MNYIIQPARLSTLEHPYDEAMTLQGDYIGNVKEAKKWDKRGIIPEMADPKRSKEITGEAQGTCSVGFCEREQKWYGWSHRAIYGFGIGSEVKRGDCGYRPTDKGDFLLDEARFWTADDHLEVTGEQTAEDGMDGVRVSCTYSDKIGNEKLRGNVSGIFQPYPDTWGKGEWTAQTLEDARQMACDFAAGVS